MSKSDKRKEKVICPNCGIVVFVNQKQECNHIIGMETTLFYIKLGFYPNYRRGLQCTVCDKQFEEKEIIMS